MGGCEPVKLRQLLPQLSFVSYCGSPGCSLGAAKAAMGRRMGRWEQREAFCGLRTWFLRHLELIRTLPTDRTAVSLLPRAQPCSAWLSLRSVRRHGCTLRLLKVACPPWWSSWLPRWSWCCFLAGTDTVRSWRRFPAALGLCPR